MNRDVMLGIGFFLLMGAGGAFLVWLNWTKIGRRDALEDQKNNVQRVMGYVAKGRTRLELAQVEKDAGKRARYARESIEAFDTAIELEGANADHWAGRAEAKALAGDKEGARRDLDRARQIRPDEAWDGVAKRCGL
jgi:tetratricopeptide (TPR) repeat protein